MKKPFFLMIIFGLVFVAGCGNSDSSSDKGDGDKVSLRFAHSAVEDNPRHDGVLKFKELVEKESKGEISVEVFANEVLGSEPQMVENVEMNDLEMVAASTFAQYEPKVDLFGLPFLFDTNEKAWEALDSEVGEGIFAPLLDENLRILAHFENGMRHVTSNKAPINDLKDFKGMKIRTPEMPILLNIFKALGANPTPMAFGELYMALQQGTVDGQENPITNIHASKFFEVQKYLSLTGHSYSATSIAISEKFWQTLSPEHQEIIEKSAKQAADFQRKLVIDEEDGYLKDIEESGMIVNTPDKDELRNATESLYDNYRDKYGDELIDQLLSF